MKYFTTTKLSDNIQETPEGFLVCLGVPIARTGWQDYGKGETPLEVGTDGKVQVYRDAKEVFSPNTIASFEGKPLTIGHPSEFISPENWKHLAKGVIQNIRKTEKKDEDGEESLLADVLVTDALAIQLVKAGLREVSCGYEALYEQTGEGKGIQTNIIGNHLALVEEGRAGPGYAINDHKSEGLKKMSKFAEKVKNLFAKALDEAEASEKESKDDQGKTENKADGSVSYDELVKMVKDLAGRVDEMSKSKDSVRGSEEKPMEEKSKDMEEKPVEEKSKDADVAPELEERLKAIEMAVAKLMEMESNEAEAMGDEDKPEEMGDEETAAEKEKKKMGDSAPKKTGLEQTKNAKSFDSTFSRQEITADKMNEINKAFYSQK